MPGPGVDDTDYKKIKTEKLRRNFSSLVSRVGELEQLAFDRRDALHGCEFLAGFAVGASVAEEFVVRFGVGLSPDAKVLPIRHELAGGLARLGKSVEPAAASDDVKSTENLPSGGK